MKLLVCALLSFAVLPIACDDGKSPTTPEKTPLPIVPLAVGARWTGSLHVDDTVMVLPWSNFITRDTLIGEETWYLVTHTRDNDTLPDTYLWTIRLDGLWQMYKSPTSIPRLIAKYPATVGEVFSEETDGSQYQVVSIDTVITVPAGTFRCYHYFFDAGNTDGSASEVFYAPGVGRVYSHSYPGGFWMNSITYVLESHEPAPNE